MLQQYRGCKQRFTGCSEKQTNRCVEPYRPECKNLLYIFRTSLYFAKGQFTVTYFRRFGPKLIKCHVFVSVCLTKKDDF